jgi:hypothetical protein
VVAEGLAMRDGGVMVIAVVVAAVLCVTVGTLVVVLIVGQARSRADEQHASERAAVTDCLANVDRVMERHVIDLRDRPEPSVAPTAPRADDAVRT